VIDDVPAYLAALPTLTGRSRPFDVEDVPDEPVSLFLRWLVEAVDDGVPEARAMTLSTVDGDGLPDARVLILRDVSERGWAFSSSASSAKGRQLAGNRHACLSTYWTAVCRQVRVRGQVVEASPAEGTADFLAKPVGSRAESLLGRQSQPLGALDQVGPATAEALRRMEADPAAVPPDHRLYRLLADDVEFWQGAADRQHLRLRYTREGQEWRRSLLWP
jgi:pyridoxamine 5'-phosphate oxidase